MVLPRLLLLLLLLLLLVVVVVFCSALVDRCVESRLASPTVAAAYCWRFVALFFLRMPRRARVKRRGETDGARGEELKGTVGLLR